MLLLSPKKLNTLLLGLTTLLLVLLVSSGEVPFAWQLGLFVLLMVLTGIPHGAVDHVVYRYVEGDEPKEVKQPVVKQRLGSMIRLQYGRFFLVYMGIIFVYSVLWLLIPKVCLAIFLLMSFYHFGQSQLYYLALPEKNILKITLYLCWGALIIGGIVFFNYEASAEVLSGIVTLPELISRDSALNLLVLLAVFALTGLIFAYFLKSLSAEKLFFEIISLLLLLALFYLAPLLIAFAIYFGLWHSLKAIQAELRHFGKNQRSLRWFYRQAWPFSLMSFIGIGILILAASQLESYISPYMLFFIAISVLTMPHMYYMQRLYQRPERV
ncbi:MAG: Brp/Blh family beta-carotene 15,15'-dioxygenase [Cyclobacteriaceae bacterium]